MTRRPVPPRVVRKTSRPAPARPSLPRRIASVVIVALAGLVAFWPMPPADVERVFSRGAYPRLQSVLTWLSNACPFSWLDVVIAGTAIWLVVMVARALRRARGQRWWALGSITWSTLVTAAVAYLLFAGLWGFNYRRVPLNERMDFEAGRVTDRALADLATRAVDEVNRLSVARTRSAEAGAGIAAVADRLAPSFARVVEALGLPPVRVARPKVPVLTLYFNATGVSGMTNPYGLETLVASNLFDYERPLVVAHEWAHLAGIGPESEATLVGALVCLRGSPDDQYSAWLDLALRAVRLVPPELRRTLRSRLDSRVVADIRAMSERSDRDSVAWLSLAAWNVYDEYLKANHVPSGVRSYDEVVTLFAGTRFTAGGVPQLRRAPLRP